MYINYNNINYICTCHPSSTMEYHGLPDNFPVPVDGEIILCADDGFVLRIDNAKDYLRQTFDNGVLTLTNIPENTSTSDIIHVENQIYELKSQLTSTDYKVIKCVEAQLVGEELPYDIMALHAERQALRDQINELEGGAV